MLKLFLSTTLILSGGNYAIASESEEALVQKSELLLAYFDCATYALEAAPAMVQELFDKGLDAGRDFYDGVLDGRISSDASIPVIILLKEGPTADFILGRLWETAVDDVYHEVERKFYCGRYSPSGAYSRSCSDVERRTHFEAMYSRQNCALLP